MKNMVMMLVSGTLGILTLAIVLTICGRMNRSVELQSNLSSAMEMTVEQMISQEGNVSYSSQEAVAECIETMAVAIDTDSNLTVDVYRSDVEKGILSMKFSETYKHPDGRTGTAEWMRTAIYNKVEEPEMENYKVRFYVNKAELIGEGTCYKSYVVQSGEHITSPVEPVNGEAVFAGWKDVNDYIADFSQPVEQDQAYYAEWE